MKKNKKPLIPPKSQVQDFLRLNFPEKSTPLWRTFLGLRDTTRYDLARFANPMIPYDMQDAFRNNSIIKIYVKNSFLQNLPIEFPQRASYGLFSFDGSKLRYLAASHLQNLTELLREEATPIHELNASVFSRFLCEILINHGYHKNDVISSDAALRNFYFMNISKDSLRYNINEFEYEKYKNMLFTPKIHTVSSGWIIRFVTASGEKYDRQNLGIEEIEITKDYKITTGNRHVLSTNTFLNTPDIVN